MQKRNTNKRDFYLFDCLDNKDGSITVRKFFLKTCIYTIKYLKKYYKNLSKNGYQEHGFEDHEQQIKSFFTPALNIVTNTFFLQEQPIERRRKRKFKKYEKVNKKISKGRVDYWASYGKYSFFIELKHGWIKFYSKRFNKYKNIEDHKYYSKIFTIYKYTKQRLKSAWKQNKRIKRNRDIELNKILYPIALVICPIYVEEKIPKNQKKYDKPPIFNSEIFTILINLIKKQMRANIIGIWRLPRKYLIYNQFNKKEQEYYPALCFIGKIKKLN